MIHIGLMAAGVSLCVFARVMEWVGIASVGLSFAIISFIHLINILTSDA